MEVEVVQKRCREGQERNGGEAENPFQVLRKGQHGGLKREKRGGRITTAHTPRCTRDASRKYSV